MAETSTAMTAHATFRFYAALNAFLTRRRRGRDVTCHCARATTTKQPRAGSASRLLAKPDSM
jgi:hypothetical protein